MLDACILGCSFITSWTDYNLGGVLECGGGNDGRIGYVTSGVDEGTGTDDETGCVTKDVDGGTGSWTDAGTVGDDEKCWAEDTGRTGSETADDSVGMEL